MLKIALKKARKDPSYLSRLKSYIQPGATPVGSVDTVCHNWTRSSRSNGSAHSYPQYSAGPGGVDARRLIWALAGKRIPNSHRLQMKCENNKCVRLEHIYTVHVAKFNAKVSKKNRKLSWGQVQAIRKLYAAGNITLRELGENYGVPFQQIHKIVAHETYKEE